MLLEPSEVNLTEEVFKVYNSKSLITLESYFFVASKTEFCRPYSNPITNRVAHKYLDFFRKDNMFFQLIYDAWKDWYKGESLREPKFNDFVKISGGH